MFVRKLKHPNGKIYIQAVQKLNGRYLVKKSFGSSSQEEEVNKLIAKAEQWIQEQQGIQLLDFTNYTELYSNVLASISSLRLIGIELVLGKIFDEIGFNQIEDKLFKQLVLYRLVYPKSKLKTTEYLYRYDCSSYSEDEIYRYMDKLHNKYKELIQQISYTHTRQILSDTVQVVFYDVTTLHFEIDTEDELRKTGFSKEGKHQHPQIVLGLLVSKGGYPLAYDIFEGNKFEGHTMLPIINSFKSKFNLKKLVIVADSGLFSNDNITGLINQGYEFILGARIKSESKDIKEQILSLELKHGQSSIIHKGDLKLIITYSDERAAKDRYNRAKGLKRLEKEMKTGRLTKSAINNRGYNKFLELQGEVNITINKQKVEQDEKWDGLKGYLTNSTLDKNTILENYTQLWQIEKAFRVVKSELRIRPIYHYKQKRIEAHICLNFAAYKVYKELERQLIEKKSEFTPMRVIEIIQSIYQIEMTIPNTQETIKKILLMNDEQHLVAKLFNFGC